METQLPIVKIAASQQELLFGDEGFKGTNEGVHQRNRELNELNDKLKLALNYAEAVLNTAHQPFLVLDGDLHILRANPAFYKAFKTTPETTEGRLLYDLGDKQWDIPELRQFLQALLLQDTSFKDCEITHSFPDVGIKTMRLNGTQLVGGEQLQILLAIEDVTDYRTAINYAETTIKTVTQPFLVLDGDLHIVRANPAFYKAFETTAKTTEGCLLYDLGDRQWDIPELRQFLQALLLQDTSFKDCEITHVFPHVGKKTMRLNGTQLVGGGQLQILLAIEDVTDYRIANDKMSLALNYAEEVTKTVRQPFLVLDGELHIIRANPAFYKAFATTPETTEGCLLYDLGDRQWDIPELREFLQALLLKDTSFKDCEITHIFPNVGEKTMRLNGISLVGGEQLQILLAIEDVSDYRTALNTLNELNDKSKLALNYAEAVLNTAHQPFLVLDGKLNILRANPAFYKAFETTPETTEGCLLYDLGDRQWDIPELREFLQALLLKDTSFKDCEITHLFPNVGKKTMRLNGTPLVGGGQLQILLAIEDVSDYRTALNTLKDNDLHKDEFLAMLAHELRNPLVPIRNALEIWKRGDAGEENEKVFQGIMDRQLQQVVRLVDDLLDVSRITRGVIVLKKDPVDLALLVSQAVEGTRHQFEERQHKVSLSLPKEKVFVQGDSTRLEQVVSNLLTNAIKYTEPGGRIAVTLERERDNALIRITDNGVGISPDLLPYIFDLFVQAERSLDRTQGGLGLGLTLVRRLVGLQGGTVEAKSAGLKKGSEFVVRLPIMLSKEATVPVPACAVLQKAASAKRRILVIEDNVDAAKTTQMLLELQGHEVKVAYGGSVGIKLAEIFKPDVILLDIGLPGMDGYEVARRLRELPATAKTLLIALSGYGQAEDLRKSKEAGFDHHLVKPADTKQLQALITG